MPCRLAGVHAGGLRVPAAGKGQAVCKFLPQVCSVPLMTASQRASVTQETGKNPSFERSYKATLVGHGHKLVKHG